MCFCLSTIESHNDFKFRQGTILIAFLKNIYRNCIMELIEIINTVLENKGRSKLQNINPNSHLRNDLGFSSLDLAELTVRIEAEFDVDIFEDGLVNTVGEIINKLEM